MVTRNTDFRKVTFERDEEACQALDAAREGWLEQLFELARLFVRIDRKAAYIGRCCGSLGQLASLQGYDGDQAMNLAWLGYALDGCEGLEEALRENHIPLPKAYQLGRIFEKPELVLEDDDWLHWARFSTLKDFRRRVLKRLEAMRQQVKKTSTMTLELGPDAKDDFEACRLLASKRARRKLSNSQTTWVLARHYREAMDPTEKEAGPRRMGPTIDVPHLRGVPAEVTRKLYGRSGGLCEFGECTNPAAERCHVRAHGGWKYGKPSGRETTDLVHGCALHHTLYDAGAIRFLAWTNDPRRASGRPVFQVVSTDVILAPKPWPDIGERADLPEWLLLAVGKRLPKKSDEEKQGAKETVKAPLPEANVAPPPTPPPEVASEGAPSKEPPERMQGEEDPPPKPEAPDGSGLVRDRGPPYGVRRALPPGTRAQRSSWEHAIFTRRSLKHLWRNALLP